MQGSQALEQKTYDKNSGTFKVERVRDIPFDGENMDELILKAITGLVAQVEINNRLSDIRHVQLPANCLAILKQARSIGAQGFPVKSLYRYCTASNVTYDLGKLKALGYINLISQDHDSRQKWHAISPAGLEFLERLGI